MEVGHAIGASIRVPRVTEEEPVVVSFGVGGGGVGQCEGNLSSSDYCMIVKFGDPIDGGWISKRNRDESPRGWSDGRC